MALRGAALPGLAARRSPAWRCFALAGATVLARLGRFHPHARFGLANGITLLRAGGAAVFAALALEPALLADAARPGPPSPAPALLLALDGLDGFAARRQRLASAFGARFDMEVDALPHPRARGDRRSGSARPGRGSSASA